MGIRGWWLWMLTWRRRSRSRRGGEGGHGCERMNVSVAEMDGEGEEVPLWVLMKLREGYCPPTIIGGEARVVTVSWYGTAWLSIILQ